MRNEIELFFPLKNNNIVWFYNAGNLNYFNYCCSVKF